MTKRIQKKRVLQGMVSAGIRRLPQSMRGRKWIPSEASILRGIRKRYGFLHIEMRLEENGTWIVRRN